MNKQISRRSVVKTLALGAAATAAVRSEPLPENALPRWRGFNLLYLFQARVRKEGPVEVPEDDFQMIADLGFDFVRIPMDYWFWIDQAWRKTGRPGAGDVLKIDEGGLTTVDRIVELGWAVNTGFT
jgi:aryl-phospho-beta-D-glucosidase BglC (GH1 family)